VRDDLLRPLLAAALIVVSGCGLLRYPIFVCRSPDGRSEIRIIKDMPLQSEYFFKVEVASPQGVSLVYSHESTAYVGLVEGHWSRDGSNFGMLVCTGFSGPLFIAYDVVSHQRLPAEVFRPVLEDQIRRKYGLGSITNVTEWACSNDGRSAYLGRAANSAASR
jgi:hypothetical protein